MECFLDEDFGEDFRWCPCAGRCRPSAGCHTESSWCSTDWSLTSERITIIVCTRTGGLWL